jgi:hypothetical protein
MTGSVLADTFMADYFRHRNEALVDPLTLDLALTQQW